MPNDVPLKDRVSELRAILNVWDFLGVAATTTIKDEYDCLIGPILGLLNEGRTKNEIREYLTKELTSHFGLSIYTELAEEIEKTANKIILWQHKK